MIFKKVCLFIVSYLIIPMAALAATAGDDFTVSVILGTDTEPPTIPANFSVSPISTDQIDLDWDASSDNVGVSGYQVFRDLTQIATTTLTSYSDTGLTASTTYSYYITAFDASLNISTSTSVLSTSTLPVTPTSTPTTTNTSTSSGGGYDPDIEIENFSITPDFTSVDINFLTNLYTKATIRWGRTADYEEGMIAIDSFRKDYQTFIDGLESGVTYQLEIFLMDNFGRDTLIYTTEFKTADRPDNQPPQNVSNLGATVDDRGQVFISWQNPDIDDFSRVRVLSNDRFYPGHAADGWLVYEGKAEEVSDDRVLPLNSRRYYTVFVYDESGNISSGAIVAVSRGDITEMDDQLSTSTELQIDFSDLNFEQAGTLDLSKELVVLQGDEETKISLAYDLLPEHLKTIVITLVDPNDENKLFSFLLRVNKDKTAYEAVIGPLNQAGLYPVVLEIMDFKTKTYTKAEGEIEVFLPARPSLSTPKLFEDFFAKNVWFKHSFSAFVGLLLAFLLLLIFWRRQKNEDKSL